MTDDKPDLADVLKRRAREGSSPKPTEAPSVPTPAESEPASGEVDNPTPRYSAPYRTREGGVGHRFRAYFHTKLHNLIPSFIPAPAGYVASDIETVVETESAAEGETERTSGPEESNAEGGAGETEEAATGDANSAAANEQQTDDEELSPAAKIRNPTLETLIGVGLPTATALTIAANADDDMLLCDAMGEAIGLPSGLILTGKVLAAGVYATAGTVLYFGLDGLLNREFPDFGKSRISEYFLKFDKLGSIVSEAIERSGRAGAYATKLGALGFAIPQVMPGLTETLGYQAPLLTTAMTLGGIGTGILIGAGKGQYVPWEGKDRLMKELMPKFTRGLGKTLAVGTAGLYAYLAAKQGMDYVLPENGGILNAGRLFLDAVYTFGLGGLGYMSALTFWNMGEDQTIENPEEEKKKAAKITFGYNSKSQLYVVKGAGEEYVGKWDGKKKEKEEKNGVPFAFHSTGLEGGKRKSDEAVMTGIAKRNASKGEKGGELNFWIPDSMLRVSEHSKTYEGRIREERDFQWEEGTGPEGMTYSPEIGKPGESTIDRGYGAKSIDELISHPEKTTTTKDGKPLVAEGKLATPETQKPRYSTFVTELIKELFYTGVVAEGRKDTALEELILSGGIRHTLYDINKKGGKNDEDNYTTFDEQSKIEVEATIKGEVQNAVIDVKVEKGETVKKKGGIEEHSRYNIKIKVKSNYDAKTLLAAVGGALEKVYENTREEFGEIKVRTEKIEANGDRPEKEISAIYYGVKQEEGQELQRKDLIRGNILSKILRYASIPAMGVCSLFGLGSIFGNDIGTFYHGNECNDVDEISDEGDVCFSVGEASAHINSGNLVAGRGQLEGFVDEHSQRRYIPVVGILEARTYVAEEAQLVMGGEIETPDYSEEITMVKRAKKKALPGSRVRKQIKKYQRSLEFAQEHPDRVYILQNGDLNNGAIDPDTLANEVAGNLLASQDSRYIMDNQTELAQKINDANDNFKDVREGDYYTQGVGFIVELPISDNPIE